MKRLNIYGGIEIRKFLIEENLKIESQKLWSPLNIFEIKLIYYERGDHFDKIYTNYLNYSYVTYYG